VRILQFRKKIQHHQVVVCEGSVARFNINTNVVEVLDDKINDGNILLESNDV
jgi:hypothetical protein